MSTENALRTWLRAAHTAIGQVLEQPIVERGELSSVIGRIREIGPSQMTDAWNPVERGESVERDEPVEEPRPEIPEPTMLSSYFA
jgi:hypothetical protein